MWPVTVWCFQCRIDYVDGVDTCVECAAKTVGSAPMAPHEVGGENDEQLAYEFNTWAIEARSRLDADLSDAHLAHSWLAGSLIIRAADEDAVDAIVATVDRELRPTFTAGGDLVEYSLADYPAEARARVLHLVDLAGVAYQIEDDDVLVVQDRDEAEVDALFDRLGSEDPERLTFGPGIPGVDPLDVVHDVFVAADKLRRNPSDSRAKQSFIGARDDAHELKLPWGYEGRFWRGVLDRCDGLHEAIEADDRDLIKENSTEIRNLLRTVL